jgi:DNA-directed RNA polymerase subunit H
MKEKMLTHEMVPKHEVLQEKDANELLERYNITKAQLPIILFSDPALKGLETKIGDIIRITRVNTTGTNYAFRLVMEL